MFVPPFDRRAVLALSIAALVPAFVLTHTVVARYRDSRLRLAEEWSTRGLHDLPADPDSAVVDFETALAYGPDRPDDRLRLAEALIHARQPVEARAQLLTLWTEQPGNGEINLELARLAAADSNVSEAVRYYHAAVDGSWDSGAPLARREARLEAARLLLAHGEHFRAQSELIALVDDLPADSRVITEIAKLMIDAGADVRARALLDRAIAIEPHNRTAAELAGGIAFRRADYRAAREYLRSAGPSSAQAKDMLAVSDAVLALDPFSRGINSAERASRAKQSLDVAQARLRRCEGGASAQVDTIPPDLQDLDARMTAARKLPSRTLGHDAEALDTVMTLVFEIEKAQNPACGPLDVRDRALVALAPQRGGRAPERGPEPGR